MSDLKITRLSLLLLLQRDYKWIGTIKVRLPHVNKKTLPRSEKANFCTDCVFLLYIKIRVKRIMPQNHFPLCCTSYFVTKIIVSIILSQKQRPAKTMSRVGKIDRQSKCYSKRLTALTKGQMISKQLAS